MGGAVTSGCRQGGAVVRLSLRTLVACLCAFTHFVLLFLIRFTITVLQNASCDDILLMKDFLDCAKIEFDAIPAGVGVSVVDTMFS